MLNIVKKHVLLFHVMWGFFLYEVKKCVHFYFLNTSCYWYCYTFVYLIITCISDPFCFLNPSQEDSRRLGSLSGNAGFATGCFMVHHDVVRNSCPTSVKTFCQSILHSMDCKYMYDVLLYVIVYMYIFFKIRFIVL